MKNKILFLLFVGITLLFLFEAAAKKIFYIKPSDCIACTIPVGLIINEFEQMGEIANLVVAIDDMPQKSLKNMHVVFLNIPDNVEVIISNSSIERYSIGGASSVIVVDTTQNPNYLFAFPISYYNNNKDKFLSVVGDSYSPLVRSDVVEIDETFVAVGNILVNDSVAMVLDKTLGTICSFGCRWT